MKLTSKPIQATFHLIAAALRPGDETAKGVIGLIHPYTVFSHRDQTCTEWLALEFTNGSRENVRASTMKQIRRTTK